jgi:hypothetical protein
MSSPARGLNLGSKSNEIWENTFIQLILILLSPAGDKRGKLHPTKIPAG